MKRILLLLVLIIPINCFAITDTAKSTIAMDMDSERILYQKNAEEQRLIASITKIMTAVIAIENADVEETVTVGQEVLSMYGSNIYIELGEKLKLKDLLYGLLLRSGNDAAIVIATHVAGSEEKFVDMMNLKAKEIGMKNTIYKNPHGLDEKTKNYSTAKDMAILSSYANKLKLYREISNTKKWETQSNKKTYIWNNRNKLLYSYKYATGGKTGYTPSAGRTLVTTASKNNLNITIVTLKDSNEYDTHQSLYENIFNNYSNYVILDKNKINSGGVLPNDSMYIKKDFIYPLTLKEKENIETVIKIYKDGNYTNNEKVGEYIVRLNNEIIYETDIFIKSKEKTNNSIFKKLINIIKTLFKK